jgi:hypothetical protein
MHSINAHFVTGDVCWLPALIVVKGATAICRGHVYSKWANASPDPMRTANNPTSARKGGGAPWKRANVSSDLMMTADNRKGATLSERAHSKMAGVWSLPKAIVGRAISARLGAIAPINKGNVGLQKMPIAGNLRIVEIMGAAPIKMADASRHLILNADSQNDVKMAVNVLWSESHVSPLPALIVDDRKAVDIGGGVFSRSISVLLETPLIVARLRSARKRGRVPMRTRAAWLHQILAVHEPLNALRKGNAPTTALGV